MTLRTSQAEITLTPSHRVFVVERREHGNTFLDKPAGELRRGDIVQVGDRQRELTNIIRGERDTEALGDVVLFHMFHAVKALHDEAAI